MWQSDTHFRFSHDPVAVRGVRDRVAAALVDEVPVDVRDHVALMTSEVASNAVRHARPPCAVRVAQRSGVVRVEVSDGDGDGTIRVTHPGPHQPSGRGLLIVDALASSWGVEDDRRTRVVWFEITYQRPPPPTEVR